MTEYIYFVLIFVLGFEVIYMLSMLMSRYLAYFINILVKNKHKTQIIAYILISNYNFFNHIIRRCKNDCSFPRFEIRSLINPHPGLLINLPINPHPSLIINLQIDPHPSLIINLPIDPHHNLLINRPIDSDPSLLINLPIDPHPSLLINFQIDPHPSLLIDLLIDPVLSLLIDLKKY